MNSEGKVAFIQHSTGKHFYIAFVSLLDMTDYSHAIYTQNLFQMHKEGK